MARNVSLRPHGARRRIPALLAFTLLVTLVASAAAAQDSFSGQTSGGAYFEARVPAGWQPADGLVIWNHGFDLSPIEPMPDLGPLVDLQLSEGYAVLASSYSLTGWAVFETGRDLEDAVHAFEQRFGIPDQVFVYGASLGGIVTAHAIEQADLGNVVGAMPICGAVGGSRIWDGGVDLRLIYDAICGNVPGAALPGGAQGLPFPPDPAFNGNALGLAVHTCLGVLAPPSARTPEQQARLDQLLAVTGLPENFVLTDMGFVTFGLADLTFDPRKLSFRQPFDNIGVDYGDAAINASIQRVEADPFDRVFFDHNYTPTGQVGAVKIVSIHTDKDGLVIVENENEYAQVVPAGNLTTGIIVEDTPTHCGFTQGETVAAWESLRGWVAGLPQPTPATLQATCEGLVLGGLAEGPCRIDPGFVIPDLDVRVRPRRELPTECVADATTLCLNDGRFHVEVEWETPRGRTGVGQTTFATNDSGAFWFFNPDNIELTVKVLNGVQNNGHFWVFYGSLTNVEFELTVTDTETGLQKTYDNAQGNFASVGDTRAIPGD